jgi:transcriptional regulator with XRE-family HTH domain
MGKERINDPVMQAVHERFVKSGLTRQELGEKMGYAPETARQAVFQFLKSGDPQISMLRRFAQALGISVKTLLSE